LRAKGKADIKLVMLFRRLRQSSWRAIQSAGSVFKEGLHVVAASPGLLVYAYLPTLFFGLTYSVISVSILHRWYDDIFSTIGSVAPHKFASVLGLVGFSAFYAALISAYFTCAISANVLAELEGHPNSMFAGLRLVLSHFFRVTRFALLSIFLFPMGIWAQRRKLPGSSAGVLGSSITLHMAQMAPAILNSKKSIDETVRDSINTLGSVWREGLVFKIGMYVCIFLVVIAPKLIQHGFSQTHRANNIGWLVSLELASSTFVIFKVLNAIFTTVLYHRVKTKKA